MMYTCDGCGAPIAAKPGDALNWTSRGKHCDKCNAAGAVHPSRHDEHVERITAASKSRGEAARARWAAMTPAQQAERVAKLKAGRARSKGATAA